MRRFVKKFVEKVNYVYGSLKIRTKIMLNFLVIIVLVTVCVSSFYYFKAASMVEDEITNTMIGILEQADINVQNVIKSVEDSSMSLYSNQQLREIFCRDQESYVNRQQFDDFKTLTDICNSVLTNANISASYFYFSNGGFYTREKSSFFSLEEAYAAEWYKEAAARNGSVVWSVSAGSTGSSGHSYRIKCSRAVIDYSSPAKEIGYISLEINNNSLANILEKIEERIEGEIYLLNAQGEVITAMDRSLIGKPFAYHDLMQELESGRSKALRINTGGTSRLMMVGGSNPDWRLAAVISLEGIKERNGEIIGFIIIISSIILAVAALMALVLSASITERIKELADFMNRVRIESDSSMPVKYNDEVSSLVRNFNQMLRTVRELINEVYAINLRRKEAELRALQEQINPHFLYNTLDSINWMAIRHKASDISEMAKLLGRFYRLSLRKGMDIVTVMEELEHVKVYVEIMQARFDGEINVVFDVDEEILSNKTVKLVLQPIVENAILHGIQKRPEQKGTVTIKGFKEKETIVLKVKDDGIGMEAEALDVLNKQLLNAGSDGGYGLKNVNQRIRLYFGENYGLSIKSSYGSGTIVEARFPAC